MYKVPGLTVNKLIESNGRENEPPSEAVRFSTVRRIKTDSATWTFVVRELLLVLMTFVSNFAIRRPEPDINIFPGLGMGIYLIPILFVYEHLEKANSKLHDRRYLGTKICNLGNMIFIQVFTQEDATQKCCNTSLRCY